MRQHLPRSKLLSKALKERKVRVEACARTMVLCILLSQMTIPLPGCLVVASRRRVRKK
jgi:hypothetical protein